MQQIDFHFNVANRSLYACRLLKKVTGMGLKATVWSTNQAFLSRVYDDLWRFEDLTFIPHAWAGSMWEAGGLRWCLPTTSRISRPAT